MVMCVNMEVYCGHLCACKGSEKCETTAPVSAHEEGRKTCIKCTPRRAIGVETGG